MKAFAKARALITSTIVVSAMQSSSFSVPTATRWYYHRAKLPQTTIIKSARIGDDVTETSATNINHASFNLSDSTLKSSDVTRRSILKHAMLSASSTLSISAIPSKADAAVGTLPEFSDTNAIFQSITIDVTDKKQYDDTISFFLNGFEGCKVLRERGADGGGVVKDAWLSFGPETLSIPSTFTLPVSSFAEYGGHSSIHLRYDPFSTTPLYKRSSGEFNNEPAPGDSIAYLQLGVPQYRISQMVKYGGNVLDAYGWVNVVSPAGLPVRGIVGIRPDPIMFLAVNCVDVAKSEEFYDNLGFVRQEYPYARLNQGQGQFEPPQPKNSVYVAPSPNSMGILLLQNKNRRKAIIPNPVLRSLNVVYAPSDGGNNGSDAPNLDPQAVDPSSLPISFIPQDYFEKEISLTSLRR
eukprot:CCRYP_002655-RB/>CCRYP_002655-RB protein AED:0.06 eAED:0.06 QI:86/1/1/1/0.4/0.33/6/2272/408